ncbi:hypothetical protein V2J09_022971 [Rumex salicifolius]
MVSQLRTNSSKKEYKLHQIVWHAIFSMKTLSTFYFNVRKQHRQYSQLIKKYTNDRNDDPLTAIVTKTKNRRNHKWKPPPDKTIKINVDGTTKDSRESIISIVIKNHNSETKAVAIRESLTLAKKIRMDQIMIESDNLTVVSHIFQEANVVADLLAKML